LLWTTSCPRVRWSRARSTRIAFLALTPFVPLSRGAGEGDYGVRKRSFRLMLKLRFSTPKGVDYGVRKRSFRLMLKLRFSTPKGVDCGVRKRSFRLMLKLTLQHSKGG
jgi:hypothetical protein